MTAEEYMTAAQQLLLDDQISGINPDIEKILLYMAVGKQKKASAAISTCCLTDEEFRLLEQALSNAGSELGDSILDRLKAGLQAEPLPPTPEQVAASPSPLRELFEARLGQIENRPSSLATRCTEPHKGLFRGGAKPVLTARGGKPFNVAADNGYAIAKLVTICTYLGLAASDEGEVTRVLQDVLPHVYTSYIRSQNQFGVTAPGDMADHMEAYSFRLGVVCPQIDIEMSINPTHLRKRRQGRGRGRGGQKPESQQPSEA